MKLLTFINLSACVFTLSLYAKASYGEDFGFEAPNRNAAMASTALGGQKIFVKGFPIILKLTYQFKKEALPSDPKKKAWMAFSIPTTSLFSDFANIKIVFINQATKIQYSIISTRGKYVIERGPGGGGGNLQGLYRDEVSGDQSQTMLLNLSNLSAESGEGPKLMELPSGNYEARVEWNELAPAAPPFLLTLVEPNEQETALLAQFSQDVRPYYKYKEVSWGTILRYRNPMAMASTLSNANTTQLSKAAQTQLQYYQFLLAVKNTSTINVGRNRLEKMSVPAYLEVDKESILLEREIQDAIRSGQPESENLQKRVKNFLEKYPSFTQRIEKIRTGQSEISRYLVPPQKQN